MRLALSASLLLLAACTQDQGLTRTLNNQVAVVTGDFDDVREPLKRMVIRHTVYDGLISTATWDPDYNPDRALTVEGLLGSSDEMGEYDALFVASGTRGLGAREYNGLDPDDHIATDAAILEALDGSVRTGRTLLVTDWAYDLAEVTWPDAVDFVGDDAVLDAAQCGERAELTATVVDDGLADALGMDTVAIDYDFSNWGVVESVGPDATVWITGDVTCRTTDGVTEHTGVPLLVSFEHGLGQVVVSTFHLDAQTDAVVDTLLTHIVGDLTPVDPETAVIEE